MAAPTIRGSSVANQSGSNSLAVTAVAGAASGDVDYVWIASQSTVTARPAGWTNLLSFSSSSWHYYLDYKVLGSGEPGSYTWTFLSTTISGIMLVDVQGASTTPNDGSSSITTNSGTSLVIPAVSPAGSTDLLLAFVAASGNTLGFTDPAGMTAQQVGNYGTFATAQADQQALAASGTTGTRTWSWSGAHEAGACMVAITSSVAYDPSLLDWFAASREYPQRALAQHGQRQAQYAAGGPGGPVAPPLLQAGTDAHMGWWAPWQAPSWQAFAPFRPEAKTSYVPLTVVLDPGGWLTHPHDAMPSVAKDTSQPSAARLAGWHSNPGLQPPATPYNWMSDQVSLPHFEAYRPAGGTVGPPLLIGDFGGPLAWLVQQPGPRFPAGPVIQGYHSMPRPLDFAGFADWFGRSADRPLVQARVIQGHHAAPLLADFAPLGIGLGWLGNQTQPRAAPIAAAQLVGNTTIGPVLTLPGAAMLDWLGFSSQPVFPSFRRHAGYHAQALALALPDLGMGWWAPQADRPIAQARVLAGGGNLATALAPLPINVLLDWYGAWQTPFRPTPVAGLWDAGWERLGWWQGAGPPGIGLIMVNGPYVVVAGQLYSVGAVAGDISSE